MARPNQHIIGKTTFSLKVNSSKDAKDVNNRIRKYIAHRLPEMLDELFSDMASADQRISLGRLKIDLGVLDLEKLDERIHAALKEALQQQLKKR